MTPPSTATDLFREILTSRVYEVARETPLDDAPRLSASTGSAVLLKREDLQPVFSFKLRGAYNRMARLGPEERARGVIAASAGNHAQGVAYSARHLGIGATIVMPETTPRIKVEAVREMGADVVLAGDAFPEAKAKCDELRSESGLTFIHPFDDPLVIAGQGTIAIEILRYGGDLHAIFVPVGGGGLIAGIGSYFQHLAPSVKIVGVQPFEADALYRSLEAGRRVRLDHVGIFADGVAVQEMGELCFEIAQATVHEVVRVTNDEICAAIRDVFHQTRSIMEPSGALAVAGMKRWIEATGSRGKRLVAILSGANMNFDRLRYVVERAELGETRERLFAVTIPERPGAFREFCSKIGRKVITEFNYRLSSREAAQVFVGLNVESHQDAADLSRRLNEAGYRAEDLTENELAKLHVRYMVGGHAPLDVTSEIACRFEFPERPGALMTFLDMLSGRWNISLFHYRNHGADCGRVLAAFEVPEEERGEFRTFLDTLGHPYVIESDNVAFLRFLGGSLSSRVTPPAAAE